MPNETTWVALPLLEAGIIVSHAIDEQGYAHVVTHDLEHTEVARSTTRGPSLGYSAGQDYPPRIEP